MDNTQTMLTAIINGQSALKEEVLKKIDQVDKKVDKLDKKIDQVEEKLTKRMDKLGEQIAYVEDDAPTREEFDELEGRVEKIEVEIASV